MLRLASSTHVRHLSISCCSHILLRTAPTGTFQALRFRDGRKDNADEDEHEAEQGFA